MKLDRGYRVPLREEGGWPGVVHCDEEYEEGVRHFEEGSGSGKMMMELSLGDGEEYQGMKRSDQGKMVVEGQELAEVHEVKTRNLFGYLNFGLRTGRLAHER
ncbi:hypothetical protein U1Q18_016911 [Sarracenia purpurea var. burkii]